jgi:hypothetical protein
MAVVRRLRFGLRWFEETRDKETRVEMKSLVSPDIEMSPGQGSGSRLLGAFL